jgi:hypothetical protein
MLIKMASDSAIPVSNLAAALDSPSPPLAGGEPATANSSSSTGNKASGGGDAGMVPVGVVTVQVPAGVMAGQQLSVPLPGGGAMLAFIPPGVVAGGTFNVVVPVPAQPSNTCCVVLRRCACLALLVAVIFFVWFFLCASGSIKCNKIG